MLTISTFSCQSHQKFDKIQWAKEGDLKTFPNRKYMVDDLVENYNLKGKKFRFLVDLLGKPQSELDSNMEIVYDIDIDYGSDIDPIYSKDLYIEFDKDTIVKDYSVREWKK